MKIFIGADHHGFHLKSLISEYLKNAGYEVVDDGNEKLDPEDDFPIFVQKVVNDMRSSDDDDPRGILLCGSGQGMCIAANRFKGIRAALACDMESVRSARNDDNSNILCLPARTLEKDKAYSLVEVWLKTAFAGAPRYKRRLKEIDEFDN